MTDSTHTDTSAVEPEQTPTPVPLNDDEKITVSKLAERVAFFFGDANMSTDNFMMKTARDNDGYIEIDTLLRFNTVKKISEDPKLVAAAAEQVGAVVLSRDREAIRRKDPLPEKTNNSVRSLHVANVPMKDNSFDVTVEEVKEVFSKFGEVVLIRFRFAKADPRKDLEKKCLGEVFVEFANPADMEKALAAATEEGVVPADIAGVVEDVASEKKEKEGEEEKTEEKTEEKKEEKKEEEKTTTTQFKLKENVLKILMMKKWLDNNKSKDKIRADRVEFERKPKKRSADGGEADSTKNTEKTTSTSTSDELVVEKISWEKGCVCTITGLPQGCDREALTAAMKEGGIEEGIYIDYSRGEKNGAIRTNAPHTHLKTIVDKFVAGDLKVMGENIESAKILEGEEEEKYWEDAAMMKAQRKRKYDNEKRSGGGGGKRRKGNNNRGRVSKV